MSGYAGFNEPGAYLTDYGAQSTLVERIINKLATTTLVKIIAVTNSGSLDAVGFVDVQPLVNQIDKLGQPTPHGTIHNLPYFRLQGGEDAIILDPKVGDIGIAVFCSRDISTVKRTKAQGNPESRRRFDWADGLYIGGVLNGVPSQYVRFSEEGVEVHSPTRVKLTAPYVELNATTEIDIYAPTVRASLSSGGGNSVAITGNITMVGNIDTTGSIVNNGHAVDSTHTHGGVQTGGGTTGTPT